MGMTMTQRVPCWIQGKPAASGSERYTEIRNPATQELIAEVPDGTATDVDQAVACAAAAFEDWRSTPISERARVFLRLQHLVTEHKEDLARMITDEQGKTLEDARGDVFRGLEVIEFACGIANHVMGETVENVARGVDTYSLVQPLGVCAGITPFNFPAMVPLWMWPIAIAAGNTFVLKPSERVPLTSMRIAELARDAGLPDGVLNLVHGGRTVVQRLCTHPLVKALSFVGSAVAGRAIYSMATAEGKRCQALMAAKNHAVILPDADRERALSGIVGAAFGASGQRCMAISVAVFVGESKSWIPGLVQRARSMRVGPGVDPKSDLGPLISPDSKRRICDLIAVGVADGADLLLDGRDCVVEGFETGNFMGPSILSGAPTSSRIYSEEIFGPVLLCVEVASLEEAIALVNANPYGNGTALFTRSGSSARRFQHAVSVGQVGINIPIPVPLPFFSFTGWKGSFAGDLHAYGKEGVRFYTQTKTVTARWPQDEAAAASVNTTIRLDS